VKFQIKKTSNGQYRFNIIASMGRSSSRPVDLIAGQPDHSLDPRRPVHEDRLSCHKPGDLPVAGRRVHYGHLTSRSTFRTWPIDPDRLNNALSCRPWP